SVSAWIDSDESGLGFGLIYQQPATIQQIVLATTTRLDVAELSFKGTTASFASMMPALRLALAASNSSGPLVNAPDLGIVVASACFDAALTLTSAGGQSATWNLTLTPPNENRDVTLSGGSPGASHDETYVNLALALAIEAVSTKLSGNATFQTVYG